VSITALAWHGLEQIPAEQQYLNERNLRLLKTREEQVRANVNNSTALSIMQRTCCMNIVRRNGFRSMSPHASELGAISI